MANYEKFDDLVVANRPVPAADLAAPVAEGLRAAGYLNLVRDGDAEFEGYQPQEAEGHVGWLHAMDNPDLFCGSPDSDQPWDVGTASATLRLRSWGAPRGHWEQSALTWTVDPTGCMLSAADTVAACTAALNDWQATLTSLVDGSQVLTLSQAANPATADIRISFGGKELDPRFGTAGGVQAVGYYPSSDHPGTLCVDSAEAWAGPVDLAGVLRHEMGHVLGLAHSDTPGSLMYPYAGLGVIDADTRLAARLLYGFPDQAHLPDRGSVSAPALCTDGAAAIAAWRGSDGDSLLYLAEFTSAWSAQTKATGGSSHGPGVAWHDGHLWLAWKGMGDDQRLFVSRHTRGVGWSPQAALDGKGTSASPALATFDGQLWLFWRGIHDDATLYCARLGPDGAWTEQRPIAGAGSSHGPTAVEQGGRLWVMWKGIRDDTALWYTSLDRAADAIWEAPTQLSWTDNQANGRVRRFPGTTAEPVLFDRAGQLWATWRGIDGDPSLYCSRMDATGWCGQVQLPGGSAEGPAAVSTGRSTVFLWRGIAGDPSLYTSGW